MSPQSVSKKETPLTRPPIVAVMGHIDHGKSTLLDFIRKSNVTETEKGGITQHLYSYEIEHKRDTEKNSSSHANTTADSITFLDTPGHAAFSLVRERGALVADIAVLVVASDDGVKPQTKEALATIQHNNLPFIVAINKMDKEGAEPERVKQGLAENGVYTEGYGGDVPVVELSAHTGDGVSDLLDMILLIAEMEELTADTTIPAEGIVTEVHQSPKRGISAALIVKNGVLKKGTYVVAGNTWAPVRFIEDHTGEQRDTAFPGSPVLVTGFNALPKTGDSFSVVKTKKEAERLAQKTDGNQGGTKHAGVSHGHATPPTTENEESEETPTVYVPLVIKADTFGSLEAVISELEQMEIENVNPFVLTRGVGNILESDIKQAISGEKALVVGFNVRVENAARDLAEQHSIPITTFDIIYNLTDWLKEKLEERRPRVTREETIGSAKIIRSFSRTKDKQIIGGKVQSGTLRRGARIQIIRREHPIGDGTLLELQQQKNTVSEVAEGLEFGAKIESRHEVAAGDTINAIETIEK